MWKKALTLAAAAISLLAACHHEPAIDPDIVVGIDGEEIRYAVFASYLGANADANSFALEDAVLSQLFDQFLDGELLIRLAVERGLIVDDPPDQRMAVEFLLSGVEDPTWNEREMAAYYAAHKAEYERPEGVRLQQILVHERQEAAAAEAALAAGEDFTQVAARFSQVPITYLGGREGRLARDDLPPAFADSVFDLDPGEVSKIFSAEYGFHIFQVVGRFPAETAPLSEVAGEIRAALRRQSLDELLGGFISEARGRYHVKIHLSNFPFDYQGSYVHEQNI
ncbi:MAG: peptidyl-prolyl cis-trans isomerase [bacterium]|nr:peptidyl-prolyl cis-trans isomerase [bacterium]